MKTKKPINPPTAKKWLEDTHDLDREKQLIMFADFYVRDALRNASWKVKTKKRKKIYKSSSGTEYEYTISVDRKSILDAYPTHKIK